MKKMLVCCATLCAALFLLCTGAMAADTTAAVEVKDAAAVNVTQSANTAGDPVFTVTKPSGVEVGQLYLVLIQAGTDVNAGAKPTKDNLYYIDVQPASSASLSMEARPKDMEEGTYIVYLSDYADDGRPAGVAAITVTASSGAEVDVTLGDVNGKDGITPADAMLAARIAADLVEVEPWQITAADVDKKNGVTPADAMLIARKAAFPDLNFEDYWD